LETVDVLGDNILKVGIAMIVISNWREGQHLFDMMLIYKLMSIRTSLKSLYNTFIAATIPIEARSLAV